MPKGDNGGAKPTKDFPAVRAQFLELLAEGNGVSAAAGMLSLNIRTVYTWREKDPVFAADWEHCYRIGNAELEKEAIRRATKGIRKPVFYMGEVVGEVQEYSDTLLMFLMKGRDPYRYCDRARAARIEAEAQKERDADMSSLTVRGDVVSMLDKLAALKSSKAKRESK